MQRIAYCHAAEIRHFMLDVLRLIKRTTGAQIHVYCNITEQASYYDRALADGDVDSVTVFNKLFDVRPVLPEIRATVVAEALENERTLGTTYNRLIMGNRIFGRGFSPGGFYHPRASYAIDADYYQVLDAFNQEIANWTGAFDRHRFTLVINPTLELSYLAETRGVPSRSYIMAGQNNWFFWTTNRYDESEELDRTVASMPDSPPVDIRGTYGSNAVMMNRISRDIRLHRVAYLALWEAARYSYWRLRGYQKARSYRIRDVSRFHFRRRQQMLSLRKLARTRLSDLKGRRFVFFPLHEEPETVLTIGAPERINQLSAVAAVARDLPAGVWLVVKETYFGVGRRPTEFYRQIADFKNVILLDVTEPGLEVARNADAIVTIRGTVGQEAGILGRPVIVLARHATYNAMPHVRKSDLDIGLKDALAWALDAGFNRERARIDGARFYAGLHRVSVDMRDFSFLRPDHYDEDLPQAVLDALARSLSYPVVSTMDADNTATPYSETTRTVPSPLTNRMG